MGLKNVLENCEEVSDVVFRFFGTPLSYRRKYLHGFAPLVFLSDVSSIFAAFA